MSSKISNMPPKNDFQKWLKNQGYYRNKATGEAWAKDGFLTSARELNDKLNEWKLISKNEM